MKKYFLLLAFHLMSGNFSTGQVICVMCYNQNDSISSGVHNLLLNGGFENSTCAPLGQFCPNDTGYNCDIANWTCTGGGSATYANLVDTSGVNFHVVEGIRAVYFGNSYCNACSPVQDDTSCVSDSFCTVTGIPSGYPLNDTSFGGAAGLSLEQTVNGLIPGNMYVLEFWAGGEANSIFFTRRGLFAVDVGFGKTFLRDKPTARGNSVGTRYLVEFNATTSSHTITFTNWGHICSSCTELELDDVRLYNVAELSPLITPCSAENSSGSNADKNNLIRIIYDPNSNEFFVNSNSREQQEVTIYDITYRKLMRESFLNTTSLNAEFLTNGIYLYEVRNKNGVIHKGKVIKD